MWDRIKRKFIGPNRSIGCINTIIVSWCTTSSAKFQDRYPLFSWLFVQKLNSYVLLSSQNSTKINPKISKCRRKFDFKHSLHIDRPWEQPDSFRPMSSEFIENRRNVYKFRRATNLQTVCGFIRLFTAVRSLVVLGDRLAVFVAVNWFNLMALSLPKALIISPDSTLTLSGYLTWKLRKMKQDFDLDVQIYRKWNQ